MASPTTLHQVQSFLALENFYRHLEISTLIMILITNCMYERHLAETVSQSFKEVKKKRMMIPPRAEQRFSQSVSVMEVTITDQTEHGGGTERP